MDLWKSTVAYFVVLIYLASKNIDIHFVNYFASFKADVDFNL